MKQFIHIDFSNRSDGVFLYGNSYDPVTNVLIVSGATAYDHDDGNAYILVFHKILYYGTKLRHSLINTNQICHFGV